MKPGWKTSEFWLSLASAIGGAIATSGILPGGPVVQIAGAISTVLAALGYTAGRTVLKASQDAPAPAQPGK